MRHNWLDSDPLREVSSWGAPFPQLPDQPRQLQQVRRPKRRPAGGEHHERIRRRKARPTRRERNQAPFFVVEARPIQVPAATVQHERELAPVQRMERMGDPEKSARAVAYGCI